MAVPSEPLLLVRTFRKPEVYVCHGSRSLVECPVSLDAVCPLTPRPCDSVRPSHILFLDLDTICRYPIILFLLFSTV